MIDVSKKVTELRQKKGYTVNKLANLSGLSQSFVRQIELGEKKPTIESLAYICDALDITLHEFFYENNPINMSQELHALIKEAETLSPNQILLLSKFLHSLK